MDPAICGGEHRSRSRPATASRSSSSPGSHGRMSRLSQEFAEADGRQRGGFGSTGIASACPKPGGRATLLSHDPAYQEAACSRSRRCSTSPITAAPRRSVRARSPSARAFRAAISNRCCSSWSAPTILVGDPRPARRLSPRARAPPHQPRRYRAHRAPRSKRGDDPIEAMPAGARSATGGAPAVARIAGRDDAAARLADPRRPLHSAPRHRAGMAGRRYRGRGSISCEL